MKLLPLLLLTVVPAALRAQDGVKGTWFVDGHRGHVSAVVLPGSSILHLHHSPGPADVDVALGRAGALSLDCVPIGRGDNLFLVSGRDADRLRGYVDAVRVGAGLAGEVQSLLSCTSQVVAVFHSRVLGEIFAFEPTQRRVWWKAFDPRQPTAGSWQAVPLDLSALAPLAEVRVHAMDVPSEPRAVAVASNGDPRVARIQVTLHGGGAVSRTLIEPEIGAFHGIAGEADKSVGTIDAFGPPSTVLEVYSIRTGVALGHGRAGADGSATIPVSGLVIGDVLRVRPKGGNADGAGQRVVFETIGRCTVGSSGLQLRRFGSAEATLAEIDSPHYGMSFEGLVSDTSPASYSALAVFGSPLDITHVADHDKAMLLGRGVAVIPVTLHRRGSDVLGLASLPIPNDQKLVDSHLCMQWFVVDGTDVVMSNIVELAIRPRDSMPARIRTQASR